LLTESKAMAMQVLAKPLEGSAGLGPVKLSDNA